MSRSIDVRLRRWALAASTLLAVLAAPAAAQAACPITATSTPFQRFGDTAPYSLVPGGHFESGSSGWLLSGASIVSGNETFYLRSKSDKRSLAIQPTGVAVSAPFCVGVEHPTFRFVARRTSGTWATMVVRLRWTGADGVSHDTTVGSVNGTGAWQPTPIFPLASVLPLWQSGQTLTARLVFDPEDWGGAWAIDDVYVDPRMRS